MPNPGRGYKLPQDLSIEQRLRRSRWAKSVFRSRRLQAQLAILVGVPLLCAFEILNENGLDDRIFFGALVAWSGVCFVLFRRATFCPVCRLRLGEGDHSLGASFRFRLGEEQLGRSKSFTCPNCETRLY